MERISGIVTSNYHPCMLAEVRTQYIKIKYSVTYVNTQKIRQTKTRRLCSLFVSSNDTHNYTNVTITKLKGVICVTYE